MTLGFWSCCISNYYNFRLAGRNGTQFYLTDAQGSLVSSFTNAAGGARMKSNQLFGPYGNARYTAGTLNTAKGFIGQYNDNTGLDYFNARYYDPVVGVFLSADTAQGNAQGMNPYAYVNNNPETYSDPSGRYVVGSGGQAWYPGSPFYTQGGVAYQVSTPSNPVPDKTPYSGGGFKAGYLPGQGARSVPFVCNQDCGTIDKSLLTTYNDKLRKQRQAYYTLLNDATAAGADLAAIIADLGSWGAVALDILSLIGHVGAVLVDWSTFSGKSLPGWLSWLPGVIPWVRPVLAFINGIKGFLEVFNPVTGWLKNLLKSFVADQSWKWASAVSNFTSSGFTLIGMTVSASNVGVPSDDEISRLSDQQAYNLCLSIYGEGLCQGR